MGTVVVETGGRIEFQVRYPASVQQPGRGDIGPEYIVPYSFVSSGVGVRIVFRIHPSDIAGKAGFEPDCFPECVAIRERESPSRIGSVRRSEFLRSPDPFSADIQESTFFLQIYAFGYRCLPCPRVYGHGDAERRAAFFGMYADHTAVEVSVFGRRDSRNHFDGFYVFCQDIPCVRTARLAEGSIVPYAHTVYFKRGSESRISG